MKIDRAVSQPSGDSCLVRRWWTSTSIVMMHGLFSSEPPAKQKKLTEDLKEENGDGVMEHPEKGAGDTDAVPEVPDKIDAATESKDTVTSEDTSGAKTTTVATESASAPMSTAGAKNTDSTITPAQVPASLPIRVEPASLPYGLPQGIGASRGMDSTVEEKGTVSALYVGRVIGKGG